MDLPSRLGIVGLGLMGGSLAKALKALPRAPHVAASSLEPGDLERALREGSIDEVHADAAEVAAEREVVVYATPLGATLALLEQHRSLWAPAAVVTDLASLKGPVLERARALEMLDRFVGGHPMTGGEGSGYGAARPNLYRDATVWMVQEGALERAARLVRGLWEAVGARPRPIDAGDHDERMIRSSHLPQILANALAQAVGEAGISRSDLGPGGRDMTRLAGSSPEMWRSLLEHSGPELGRVVGEVGENLEQVARDLRQGKLDAVMRLMERTRSWTQGEPWT